MLRPLLAVASVAVALSASDADVLRAQTRRPRDHYRGQGSLADANRVLNGQLTAALHLDTRACELFNATALQELHHVLYGAADQTLLQVYAEAQDNRRLLYSSPEAMQASFDELNAAVAGRPELHDVLRDGLCHQAVMWFIHHLPRTTQEELTAVGLTLPLLPLGDHTSARGRRLDQDAEGAAAEEMVLRSYKAYATCQACHVQPGVSRELVRPAPAAGVPAPPVWPSSFKAHAFGFAVNESYTESVDGTYWYDYANNRARGTYDYNGTKPFSSGTQLWLGNDNAYYVFMKKATIGKLSFCIRLRMHDDNGADIGVTRPDWMARSYEAGMAEFIGNETVDGQQTQHWRAHWGHEPPYTQNTFDMWSNAQGYPVIVDGKNPNPPAYVVREGVFHYDHFETPGVSDADFAPFWTWQCLPVGAEEAKAAKLDGVDSHIFSHEFRRRAHDFAAAKFAATKQPDERCVRACHDVGDEATEKCVREECMPHEYMLQLLEQEQATAAVYL